jgi:hypothetical protein
VDAAARKRRRRKRLWIAVGAAVLLYLLAEMAAARGQARLPDLSAMPTATRADPWLARTATTLAGRQTTVTCWSHAGWRAKDERRARDYHVDVLGPWAAFTEFAPSPAIELSPEICIELDRLEQLRSPVWHDGSRVAIAWALETLGHESVHASGDRDEAVATCWAMQRLPRAAKLLGRSTAEGHYLARLFWRVWYPRVLPAYRSAECRNGGALDLHPDSNVWP